MSARVEREEEDTSDEIYKKGNKLIVGNVVNAPSLNAEARAPLLLWHCKSQIGLAYVIYNLIQ
ncbi:unnamed protein product [Prunus armeniaca]